MEIREYISIIRKRFMFILVITLLATFTSAVFSYLIIKPKYQADISVIIGKNQTAQSGANDNYSDLMMYQQLVKTYSTMATSRKVLDDVKEKLNLSLTSAQIGAMVSTAPQADTQFLRITVKSDDPQNAQNIANQIAKSLKEQGKVILNEDNVHILDEAALPTGPSSPRPLLNMAIAFFLGLMASAGVVFLVEYMDNTVKSQEEIEKLIGVPVIGVIPMVLGEE